MTQYCDDCGCKVYSGHCVNCHEETFIAQQYREDGLRVPEIILNKELEQSYEVKPWPKTAVQTAHQNTSTENQVVAVNAIGDRNDHEAEEAKA